jgi:addiction module HigA family antidote
MNYTKSSIGLETHPGEFIRQEFLQAGGQSIFDFALKMGISEKVACEILVGIQPITPSIADKLASLYGIQSQHWLDMQASYNAQRALDGLHGNCVKR